MPFVHATDGTRIHYEVTGKSGATPVLMIQGLGASKNAWNLQRIAMATRFRIISFDNRGAGRSDKPAEPFTLEQMADDAIAVLDAAGIDTAHVVGASMGGVISQIVAVKFPHRVRSLTLVCTACRNHPWRQELLQTWAKTAAEKGMIEVGKVAAQWVMSPRSFRRLVPAFTWMGPLAALRPRHSFVSQIDAILNTREDLVDQLSTITAPTMVIVGNQDILTPRGDSEEIAERIPNAELVVIAGAAHGLMMEHSSTFNRILIEFLQRTELARVSEQQLTA
ncbi:3-oxoadipate enol-lactonase [Actinomycetes bacterium]|nr:3-oxoadipate enol-lactonase [Actinomycetes bacterium]